MNSIQKNASDRLDAKARDYAQKHKVDYRTAVYAVARIDGSLSKGYAFGDNASVKNYDLSAPRREMVLLVNDPEKTRRLASALLDKKAREKLINIGPGVSDLNGAYRTALSECRAQYPSLATAAESGYISADDFALVAMLVPSTAREIEEGRYSHSSRCAHCGEHVALCRGKKLARQKGIDEDDVKAFSDCILAARARGSELDMLACYY